MGLFNMGCPTTSSGLIDGCYTLSEVPGKKTVRALGLIHYTQKGLAGDIPKESNSLFSELKRQALELGANAVINVKLATGSYEQQGFKQITTYVIAYGDAVVLEDT